MQNGNKIIKKANLIQRKSISVINTITTDKKKVFQIINKQNKIPCFSIGNINYKNNLITNNEKIN